MRWHNRTRHRRTRPAITLVELLVVLGIIGVLLAIVLPAVFAARQSSLKMQCQNSLRQIALGCQQYESTYGHFCAGLGSETKSSNWPFASLFVRTLPYLEQQAIFDEIEQEFKLQTIFVTHKHLSTPVANFACPSDHRVPGPAKTHNNYVVGLTSYLGVAGTNHLTKDGVFFMDSSTRLSQITDGSSNTLMIGERPPSSDAWFGWWYAGFGQDGEGNCDMILGLSETNSGYDLISQCGNESKFERGNINEICDSLHYWSLHPGGANFAMADGSVHFLSYTAAADILPKLATRAGAEPVTLP